MKRVRQFYDGKHKESRAEREASPLITLRKFNNFIKSVLVADSLVDTRGTSVLDLCGGTGGDLAKYAHSRVAHVCLIDIAQSSVDEACRRHAEMSTPYRASFVCGDAFDADVVKNAIGETLFDLVTCQFALHYAPCLDAVFRIVSSSLKAGGKFVATFPDAHRVKSQLQNKDIWETSLFRIEKSSSTSYVFSMGEAVGRVQEYFVEMPAVLEAAYKYGLSVVFSGNFQSVFRNVHPRHKGRAKNVEPCFCDDLYVALVLKKRLE